MQKRCFAQTHGGRSEQGHRAPKRRAPEDDADGGGSAEQFQTAAAQKARKHNAFDGATRGIGGWG